MPVEVMDISLQGADSATTAWLSKAAEDIVLALDSAGVSEEDAQNYFVLVIAPPKDRPVLQVVHRSKAREALLKSAKRLRQLGVKAQVTEAIIAKCEAGSTAEAIRIGYFDITGCGSAQILRGDVLREMHQGEASADALRKFRVVWEDAVARVKRVVIPPDTSTAGNMETVLMAVSYTFDALIKIGLPAETLARLIGMYARANKVMFQLLERADAGFHGRAYSGQLQEFGMEWMQAGFPKLEVGQKLAATLALTDVPNDIEVVAPWKAWSLIVPPGLFGKGSEKEGELARLWCMGTEVRYIVMSKGGFVGEIKEYKLKEIFQDSGTIKLWAAINSLVKGACLALSNPDDYKREKLKDQHGKVSKKRREGEPDFGASRFMLSAPVQIDLRQMLLDEIAGKKRQSGGGGSPMVQFFVRGHWRNQAHGPGRSLRKQIRIEGFWKGPEEGRVLLRNYKVKEDEDAKTTEGGAQDTQVRAPGGS